MRFPSASHGEFARLRGLIAGLPEGEGVLVGPGDDAAVMRPSPDHDLVVTTDTFVEGRHYRTDLLSPEAVGRRLAAANLSDLAAMAARPRWATIACTVPPRGDEGIPRVIELACAAALAEQGAAVVGGNLSAGDGPSVWTVTLIGEVARNRWWSRDGARPGDVLATTGHPGRSGAAIALALWHSPPSLEHVPQELFAAYARPECRVEAALALAALGVVRAAIDISDGLAADLAHLCEASGVGAQLREDLLPVDEPLLEAARLLAGSLTRERADIIPAPEQGLADHLRFGSSDDYELLLAIDPARVQEARYAAANAGAALHVIGVCTESAAEHTILRRDGREEPLPSRGYDHFA
jgi:thiamine-monophosphate kinase